ncbi:unnamed protein product [Caenorhabditis bovis]|uniref:Uncharacterized protein n=1 Tax=Caenorhabditis bovis TaxID=2654633 RepID=A0A8S1EJ70_9PELO|nr:unnamed protein product [Caenorhabditis bovis]
MEQINVRHRLSELENCAAKLAELKSFLKQNYETTLREINQVMTMEISMIRAREEDLIDDLTKIHDEKEKKISRKQRAIENMIGACQHALASNEFKGLPTSIESLLLKCDEDDVRIEFQADIVSSSDNIAKLGNIRVGSQCERRSKPSLGITLPRAFEDYEDDMDCWLAKKSCQGLANSPTTPHEAGIVKGWLDKLEGNRSDLNVDLNQMALETESTDETASFEVINDTKTRTSTISHIDEKSTREQFSQRFIKNLHRPMCDWLLKVSESAKCAELPPAPVPKCFQDEPLSSESQYAFNDVIQKVISSNNDQWIQKTENSEDEKMETTSCSTEPEMDDFEKFDQSAFIDNIAKLFESTLTSVATKSSTPSNDDIAIWRNIINQMQNEKSKEWLLKK